MRSSLRKQGNYSCIYEEFIFDINVFIASFIRYITLNKGLLPSQKGLATQCILRQFKSSSE